jgi:predicted  nucleic acid-binding Zn-ribbon protein
MCREKYQEICLSLGLDIETKAKQKEYKNMPIKDYKKMMESESKLDKLNAAVSAKQKEYDEINQKCQEAESKLADIEEQSKNKGRWMQASVDEQNRLEDRANELENRANELEEELSLRQEFESELTFGNGRTVQEYVDSKIDEYYSNGPDLNYNDQQEEEYEL